MAYETLERSTWHGAPVELYRFVLGTQMWTFTSSDGDGWNYLSEDYAPIPIHRSEPEQSEEPAAHRLSITMPRNEAIPRLFVAFVPPQTMWLTIFRKHRADAEVVALWQGVVRSAAWKGSEAELQCDPIEALLARMGLRRLFGPLCNHMLYDAGCTVPASAFMREATILNTTGFNLVASEFASEPDGWFTAGFVKRANGDMRFIMGHVSDTITLLAPFPGTLNGEVVEAYAGCDHLFSTCVGKFGDYTEDGATHGGWSEMPTKNPFQTGLN
jgi:uncharacterized phage protein (TIGR02218 family)